MGLPWKSRPKDHEESMEFLTKRMEAAPEEAPEPGHQTPDYVLTPGRQSDSFDITGDMDGETAVLVIDQGEWYTNAYYRLDTGKKSHWELTTGITMAWSFRMFVSTARRKRFAWRKKRWRSCSRATTWSFESVFRDMIRPMKTMTTCSGSRNPTAATRFLLP